MDRRGCQGIIHWGHKESDMIEQLSTHTYFVHSIIPFITYIISFSFSTSYYPIAQNVSLIFARSFISVYYYFF